MIFRQMLVRIATVTIFGILTGTAAYSQATAPCSQFFEEAFVGWRSPPVPSSERCVERFREVINGKKYIFVDVVGYTPTGFRNRLSLAHEAIQRSVTLYNSWFATPPALIISGRSSEYSQSMADNDSGAIAETHGRSGACAIWLDDESLRTNLSEDSDQDQYKRTVAHELFHCVQASDPTLDHRFVKWRDEGTAEYFSGLAIPTSVPGSSYYDKIHNIKERPLYTLRESAYPFFAFLGRERRPDAVVSFLQNSGRAGSRPGRYGGDGTETAAISRQTLRTIPGIDELFHEFGRRLADGKLTDESGRPLPTDPRVTPVYEDITQTATVPIRDVIPFTVNFRFYRFEQGVAWKVTKPNVDAVRGGIRETSGDTWSDLPTAIDKCQGPYSGIALFTSTADQDGPFTPTLNVKEEPSRGCPCPQGDWFMNTETLRASPFSRVMPGELVSGGMTLRFTADGTATAIFNSITFESSISPTGAMRSILNGTLKWTYRRRPFSRAELAEAPPTGPGVDAFALERDLVDSDAVWRTEFLNKGTVLNAISNPFRRDQSGGGKSIAAAYCVGGSELHIVSGRASVFPGTARSGPPYTGVFKR